MKEKQKKPNYLKFGENKCGGIHLVFTLFAILTDFKQGDPILFYVWGSLRFVNIGVLYIQN